MPFSLQVPELFRLNSESRRRRATVAWPQLSSEPGDELESGQNKNNVFVFCYLKKNVILVILSFSPTNFLFVLECCNMFALLHVVSTLWSGGQDYIEKDEDGYVIRYSVKDGISIN